MSNFNDSLKGLTGYQINIVLNDGTKLSGQLAEVSTDYLTVYSSENETLYYPISQIQAVTKNSKDVEALPVTDDHLKGEKMSDVLSQSLLSWVTINGSGKASYSGILSAVEEDHLVLTQGKDRVYLKHASVLNIYDGTKKTTSENQEKSSNSSSSSKDNSSQKQDSSKNQESSNKSSSNQKSSQQSSKNQSSTKSSTKNTKKKQQPAFYYDELEGAKSSSSKQSTSK
jgi:small nuclear ribonucleoprotein (snRNP)-like protein